jgi:hypothetical protein
MSTIEEKARIITFPLVARRIKRELDSIKMLGILKNDDDIDLTKNYAEDFNVTIKNCLDNRLYTFIISPNYPFLAPRLEINNKPYSHYFRFRNNEFQKIFYKIKGERCFCCESLLCENNWVPQITLNKIMYEVDLFHKECREIAYRVIINVIKRKYLIDDINILEWLY